MRGPNNPIGWCSYSWNPVSGCLNNCEFCYAERIAERFRGGKGYPQGFEPTFHPHKLREPSRVREPNRIFVCSMGELFGSWVPNAWREAVLEMVRGCPWHTFQFLTKCPAGLPGIQWPENAWVGVTVTGEADLWRLEYLRQVKATVRFVSLEPLLSEIDPTKLAGLDWWILGAMTGPGSEKRQPRREWVQGLIDVAEKAGVPIYLKHNLRWPMRTEQFPS
jgi:protein gp37